MVVSKFCNLFKTFCAEKVTRVVKNVYSSLVTQADGFMDSKNRRDFGCEIDVDKAQEDKLHAPMASSINCSRLSFSEYHLKVLKSARRTFS